MQTTLTINPGTPVPVKSNSTPPRVQFTLAFMEAALEKIMMEPEHGMEFEFPTEALARQFLNRISALRGLNDDHRWRQITCTRDGSIVTAYCIDTVIIELAVPVDNPCPRRHFTAAWRHQLLSRLRAVSPRWLELTFDCPDTAAILAETLKTTKKRDRKHTGKSPWDGYGTRVQGSRFLIGPLPAMETAHVTST